jgi:hypothetical protein
MDGSPMTIWVDSLRPFYNYLLGNNIATQKFPSLLRKRGIRVERKVLGSSPKDVVTIQFNLDEVALKRLRVNYLGQSDDNTELDQNSETNVNA